MPITDVTFRDMDRSPALEETIARWVARLERVEGRITRCNVVISRPHRHHRHGATFHVTLEVIAPSRVIAIGREPELDEGHVDAHVAVADAFRAARRRLQETVRIRRGEIKAHA